MTLVKPRGMVGLLTPSGIASDKTAAKFFKGVSTQGRLKALYDFENRRTRFDTQPFFPDVDSRFKFCALIVSPSPMPGPAHCAFFLQDVSELQDPERCFPLTAADFARVNPNTGTAPIFRSRRDAALTTAIYSRLPVLVDHSSGAELKTWPVKYATMFHMANDSRLFRTRKELEEKDAAYPLGPHKWRSGKGDYVPLYQGRSVEAYDHRFAGVDFNPESIRRGYVSVPTTYEQHTDPVFSIQFQYFVSSSELPTDLNQDYILAYRRSTATTNARTMVSAIAPFAGYGDSLFLLFPSGDMSKQDWAALLALIQANLMSLPFDFTARNKLQGQNFSWYILEQLPVVPPDRYDTVRFGLKTAREIVREAVLELTYTAHDMAPFARDMGYVEADHETVHDQGVGLHHPAHDTKLLAPHKGDIETDRNVKPPFIWDEAHRLNLRAKLDAIYFHLYGVTNRDDVRYIYSTFPIVERQEMEAFEHYRSRDLCLAWMNALAAGDPDAVIDL